MYIEFDGWGVYILHLMIVNKFPLYLVLLSLPKPKKNVKSTFFAPPPLRFCFAFTYECVCVFGMVVVQHSTPPPPYVRA